MRFIPRIIPTLSLLLLLSACSTGTDPGPCETVECRRIAYYMEITRTLHPIDSIEADLTARAVFLRRGGIVDRVRAGDDGDMMLGVSFNDVLVPRSSGDEGGTIYRYDGAPQRNRLKLMPPGDSNVWVVRPDPTDTLRFAFVTPEATAEITTVPEAVDDTISTDSDLQISWPSSSITPDVRNQVSVLVLQIDSGSVTGTRFLDIERDRSGFTQQTSITIPADSLRSWSTSTTEIQITLHLDHYRIRDFRLGPVDWARTVYRESLYRRLHIRAE